MIQIEQNGTDNLPENFLSILKEYSQAVLADEQQIEEIIEINFKQSKTKEELNASMKKYN